MLALETIRKTSTSWAWWSTSPSRPAKATATSSTCVKDVKAPVFLILNKIDLVKKSKLLPLIDGFQQDGRFAEIIPVSAQTGDNVDRLERADHRPAAGRAGALSGRLPDRPARAVHGGRDGSREAAAVHARRDSVLERGGRRPIRGTAGGRRAAEAVLHDRGGPRIAEADHRRQGRRHDQADRHGGPRRARSVLFARASSSICTCRWPPTGARTIACCRTSASSSDRQDDERYGL